jgi:hypothetical protein
MKNKIPLNNGDEYDAFSKNYRKWTNWQKGELKKIKRKYNKRVRRENKKEINIEMKE